MKKPDSAMMDYFKGPDQLGHAPASEAEVPGAAARRRSRGLFSRQCTVFVRDQIGASFGPVADML